MEIMAEIRLIEFATPEYDQMIKLRTDILRIPLGLSFSVTDLSMEYEDILFGYFDDLNQLRACLVLTAIDTDKVKMRQVAVSSSLQGMGVGTLLVKASEQYARKKCFKLMVLNARDVAFKFYEKLNYEKVGEPFIEVGINHSKMQKEI